MDYNPNYRFAYNPYEVPRDNIVPPTWHTPTFIFALIIITVLIVGVWTGNNKNSNYSYRGREYYW